MSKIDNYIKNFNMQSPFNGYNGDCVVRGDLLSFTRSMNNIEGQAKFTNDMKKRGKNRKRKKKK